MRQTGLIWRIAGCGASVWFQALLLLWPLGLRAESSNSNLVRKVVHQYALTSANDFSQRDPMDWRLLGAPDGTNWSVLDERQGEMFTERHQRRLFHLTNSLACNAYRLEILRVRDPSAANSAHLAEIEPLGSAEDDFDPVPCLEDLITVQGENGPLESRYQAFDSQLETKWLDFADAHAATRSTWIQWQYVWPSSLVITNLKQLQGLRSRASAGYPIRIEGVLVNRMRGSNVLCFLDSTGYMEIPGGDDSRYSPGQPLLLQGVSQWLNKQVGVSQPHITPQGDGLPREPRPISLEEPLAPEDEMQWVEAEGVAQFCVWRENRLAFELAENGRSLSVQILHWDPDAAPPGAGQRVRVRGVCSGSLDVRGQRVAGTIWAPGLDSVWPVNSNQAAAASSPASASRTTNLSEVLLTNIWQVRQLTPEQLLTQPRVAVRGVVTETFGSYVQDETAGIELWLGRAPSIGPPLPGLGTFVEVSGRGGWIEGHGPVLHVDRIQSLGKGRLPNPRRPGYKDVANGKVMDEWIEIEGVVRSTDGSHLLLVCEGGQLMATIRSASVMQVKGLVDATVRLRGLNVSASDDRGHAQGIQLLVPSLECVEVERSAPDPFALSVRSIASLSQFSGPKELVHRVKVEGVVTLRQERRIFIQDATGSAMAIGRGDIILDSPPGAYHWAFYQAPEDKRAHPESWGYEPGDKVEVVGFPESREGYSTVLTEALVRQSGRAAFVAPVAASMNEIGMGKLDSTLVTLEALVLGQEKLGADLVFEMQSGQTLFQAVLSRGNEEKLPIATGSRVRVSGVCQVEPNPFPELGRRIASFKLLAGSPASISVLESPSWWTLSRALAAAGGLAVILAIAAAWIGSLRGQVDARTCQLKAEVEQHKRTEEKLAEQTARLQAEIEERKRIEAKVEEGHKQLVRSSRMAGMAEVATSVLHNVGNVLNSSNMLASLISEQLHSSKIPTLVRTVALLQEHQADLGEFLSRDARGRYVPLLLAQLSAHLDEDRNRILTRMDALAESVQHIKEIVAMQQKYARISTPDETVSIAEVVEDALRLSSGSFSRDGIAIFRDYQQGIVTSVDRHKVLQILFNLLENARYACLERAQTGGEVRVSVRLDGPDCIEVSVADNGVGIAPEHLPQLFSQGFFMRKEGHGFGLHSSALAAQDLGGSLSVQSGGLGRGATFQLHFPLNPPVA